MSQPYGKTGSTSGWPRNFLRSLASFNFSQLNVSAGIRAGVLIASLLIIGVFSNHIREATLAALGTIFFLREDKTDTSDSHAHSRFSNQRICIGLFIISYLGVYPNTVIIVMISAVVFCFGVALPGINNIPPWTVLVVPCGGLWGVLGAITSLGWQLLKKNPVIEVVKPPVQAHIVVKPPILDYLIRWEEEKIQWQDTDIQEIIDIILQRDVILVP